MYAFDGVKIVYFCTNDGKNVTKMSKNLYP